MNDLLREYWRFLRREKRYWMIPLLGILLILGLLAMVSAGAANTSFVYTLF